MTILFLLVSLCSLASSTDLQPLDPGGPNVCRSGSVLPSLSCCPGWRQEGNHCSVALCYGAASCRPGERCVRPGECRCPHGYFGANCVTRCPDQFWGRDCREACPCHPNGKCDAFSGRCACYPDRWGWRCSQRCHCLHGVCEAETGRCQCQPGWWGAHCSKLCQCQLAHSQCDQLTGRCNCSSGFWGRRCNIPCYCGQSPCTQRTGQCQCRQGWWGTLCDQRCVCGHGTCDPHNGLCACHPGYQGTNCSEACTAGFYGHGCKNRCGHCKEAQPCAPVNGSCPLCQAGWQGSLCDQHCPPGFYGDSCKERCPKCRDGEPCNAQTGLCGSCNPGWTGSRCDAPCVSGTYGAGCRSPCPQCYHGTCHHVTGDCTCEVGYTGDRCNSSCQAGTYGMDCSKVCGCLGASCDRVTGNCRLSKAGVAVAAVLLSLLLLLCVPCCCHCRSSADDPTSREVNDSAPMMKMKHRVQGILASLGSALPCLSFGNQKLPKITVLHHDAELTFNCSFIDSPSAGGDSASCSSLPSDDVSPLDDTLPFNGTLPLQAPAEPWEAAGEERLQPADIPRTSSMAKAKRPSVSFAEGTRFGTQPRQSPGSEPQPPALTLPHWKRKPLPPSPELLASASLPEPGKPLAGQAQPGGGRGVGRWSRMRDMPVEGVQAVLRHFGSFQRQRGSGERSHGARSRKGQTSVGESAGSGTLSRKPLIPTTPVLRQLVAGVAAQSGAGLAVVPAGGSLPPHTHPDPPGSPCAPDHDTGPG